MTSEEQYAACGPGFTLITDDRLAEIELITEKCPECWERGVIVDLVAELRESRATVKAQGEVIRAADRVVAKSDRFPAIGEWRELLAAYAAARAKMEG